MSPSNVRRESIVPNQSGVSSNDAVVRVQQVDAGGAALVGSSTAQTEIASAAFTSTQTGPAETNTGGIALFLFLDITASPNNAETLTVSVQGQDPASSKWVTLGAFTAITASDVGATPTTATFAFVFDPAQPAVALTGTAGGTQVLQRRIPRTWRAVVTHSSTGSWTYSLASSVSAA